MVKTATLATLSGYVQRPSRAAEADGLNDITGGIVLFAITFMWYAQAQFSSTIHGHNFQETAAYKEGRLFLIVTVLSMFAVIFLSKWCVKTLRERFVYSRLGYAAPRIALVVRQKLILLAVGVTASFLIPKVVNTLSKTSAPWPTGTLVTILGIFSAIVYFWYFAKFGFARHLVVAGVSVLAAILLAAMSVDDVLALRYFTLVSGATLIAGGAIAFSKLLHTPLILADESK